MENLENREKWMVSYLRSGREQMAHIQLCRNKEHLIEIIEENIVKLGEEYSYKIIKRME